MATMMEEMNREEPNRTVINQYHRVWQRKSIIIFSCSLLSFTVEATQEGAKELGQNGKMTILLCRKKRCSTLLVKFLEQV